MTRDTNLGFAGAGMLALGTFCPDYQAVLVGGVSIWQLSVGLGVAGSVVALIAALGVQRAERKLVAVGGILGLLLTGWLFAATLSGDGAVSVGWGWFVMVLGSAALLVSAFSPAIGQLALAEQAG